MVREKLSNYASHVLSNNRLCLRPDAQYMLLFLVLVVNPDQFRILQSYMLLLQLSVRMCSNPKL